MDTLFLICICFILVFLLWITYYGHQRFKRMNQEMQRLKYDISAVHKSLEGISRELQNLMMQRPPAIPSLQHLLQSGAAQVPPEPIQEDETDNEDENENDEEEMNRMMEEIMEETEQEKEDENSDSDNDDNEDSGSEEEEEESNDDNEDGDEKESNQEEEQEEEEENNSDNEEDEEKPKIVVPPTPVRPTRPARGRGRGRGGNARQAIRTIQERIESKLHE